MVIELLRTNLVPDQAVILHHQQVDDESATRSRRGKRPASLLLTQTPAFRAEMRSPAVEQFFWFRKAIKCMVMKNGVAYLFVENIS